MLAPHSPDDIGKQCDALAGIERAHGEQERPFQAEFVAQTIDHFAGGGVEDWGDPFGDHRDAARVRLREMEHIAACRIGNGDHRVGAAKQAQPQHARPADPWIVARHHEGNQVVNGDHHREPRAPRLPELDCVVEIGRGTAERIGHEQGVGDRLQRWVHDPDPARRRHQHAAHLRRWLVVCREQQAHLRRIRELTKSAEQTAFVASDPAHRGGALERPPVHDDPHVGRLTGEGTVTESVG